MGLYSIHSILAQYISLTVTRYDSGAIQRGGYCKLSRKRWGYDKFCQTIPTEREKVEFLLHKYHIVLKLNGSSGHVAHV